MSATIRLIRIPLLVLALACSAGALSATAASTGDDAQRLYLLTKLFIEPIGQLKNVDARLEPLLKQELQKRGFQVVERAEDAQGVLSGDFGLEVTLDGDKYDITKADYELQLRNSAGERVWKARLKFKHRDTYAEDHRYAARKLAEKLSKAWRKSARRAGLPQSAPPNRAFERTRSQPFSFGVLREFTMAAPGRGSLRVGRSTWAR